MPRASQGPCRRFRDVVAVALELALRQALDSAGEAEALARLDEKLLAAPGAPPSATIVAR